MLEEQSEIDLRLPDYKSPVHVNNGDLLTPIKLDTCSIDTVDIKSIISLFTDLFPINYNYKFFETLHSNTARKIKIVKIDRQLVGLIMFFTENDTTCRDNLKNTVIKRYKIMLKSYETIQLRTIYLASLGITSNFRKRGICSVIYQFYEKYLEEQGYNFIYLHVAVNNEGAIEFYKKLGFIITKTIHEYYKMNDKSFIDGYEMGKLLSITKVNRPHKCVLF